MILEELTLLNETTLECLDEFDEIKVIKNFTDTGIKILGADFGFVWLSSSSKNLKLVYKSPHLPFKPNTPKKEGRIYSTLENLVPRFVVKLKKRADKHDISQYVKSFVIIPLVYKKAIYGTMVLCFKKPELFSKEKRALSIFIGNSIAQVININRLILSELETQKRGIVSKNIAKLLQVEKLKTEFIANATHELRTPLAIIKGNVDLAMQSKLKHPKSPKSAFRAIDYEIKHLSHILSDLTIITSNVWELKNRIKYEKIKLRPLIAKVVERCKHISYKKNISITSSSTPNITILGDKIYLEKMFVNLVKNSVLYGNRNGHTKILTKKSKGFVTINVSDDGIGIPKEDLPYVFERFYRVDKSHSSGGSSIGLGLAIVKWIAEIHGGEVHAKSLKGKGSIFTVSLPIKLEK